MINNIILAGVGGQGILSIAATIGMAAVKGNLELKQAEVHGMSQRGGAVQSHLRISDKTISSDLIPEGKTDIILSVEPMESLRYLPFLSANGWIVSNSKPFINIDNYPDKEEVYAKIRAYKNHILIDADKIAKEIKSPRSSNIVMLGAASPFIDVPFEDLEEGVRQIFGRKGEEVVNVNLEALRKGREFTQKNK